MKNLTSYKDFKKLNEEVNPTSETGYSKHNDPFINVPGNFAGAEKTLVGSAVKKIFMFVKRKGFQIYLNKFLKPQLSNTYLKGLLKFCIIEKIPLPKGKIYYTVFLIKDKNNNEISKEGSIKESVKFNFDGEWKFDEGATITTNKEEGIEDGYYKFVDFNTIFKTIDSKVVDIEEQYSDFIDRGNGIKKNEIDDVSDINKKDELSNDINDISKIIISTIENKKVEIDKLNTYLEETKEMLKTTENGLETIINNLKNENLTPSKKSILEKDKIVYEEDIQHLKNIISTLNDKIKKISSEKSITLRKGDKYNYIKNDGDSIEVEFVDVDEDGIILKDNTNKQFSVGKNKANRIKELSVAESLISEELDNPVHTETKESNKITEKDLLDVNKLSKTAVDLDDKDFNNRFNDDERKEKATKRALDYSSDIVKIQLAAEKLFTNNAGQTDRKLQNNWLKMVQNVKQKYSHYFNVDELDPQMLRGKLGKDVIDKNNNSSRQSTGDKVLNNVRYLKDAVKISENDILKDKVKIEKFSKSVGNFSIIKINNDPIISYLEKINNIYYFKVIGGITDWDKLLDVKSEDELKEIVYKEKDRLPSFLTPPKDKFDMDGTKYIATFLMGNNNAPSENKNSSVTPIYVYSKNEEIVLYKYKKIGKENSMEIIKNNKQLDDKIKIVFGPPFVIDQTGNQLFKINVNEEDGKFTFGEVLKKSEYYNKIITNKEEKK